MRSAFSVLSRVALAKRLLATLLPALQHQLQRVMPRCGIHRGTAPGLPLPLAFILLWLVVGPMLASCTGEASNEPSSPSLTPAATRQSGGPREATPGSQEGMPSPVATVPEASATSGSIEAAPEVSVTPTPLLAATWELTFERTGGFAGLAQLLTVDSQGQATFQDLRSARLTQGQLSPEEMTELQSLLEGSDFFSQDVSQSRACFDCFNYGISLTQDSQSRLVRANSLGLDSRLEPLVEWLAEFLGKGLNP